MLTRDIKVINSLNSVLNVPVVQAEFDYR